MVEIKRETAMRPVCTEGFKTDQQASPEQVLYIGLSSRYPLISLNVHEIE